MSEAVSILNVNLKNLSDDEVRRIAVFNAYACNTLIPEQNLSKKQYARILRLWGKNPERNFWFEDKKDHEVMYVTNKILEGTNQQGLFARGELEWHCNGVLAEDPEDCVTLYCKQPTKDPCNTQFLNSVPAYRDLPRDVKLKIHNTQCIISSDDRGFHKLRFDHLIKTRHRPRMLGNVNVYKVDRDKVLPEEQANLHASYSRCRDKNSSIRMEMREKRVLYNEPNARWNCVYKKLVHNHRLTGQTGLYFPVYNVIGFSNIPEDEWQDLYNFLFSHYVQDKYMYDHEWKEGDLMLFDNTQGIHKRYDIPLDENGVPQERELWRGAFWYDGIH